VTKSVGNTQTPVGTFQATVPQWLDVSDWVSQWVQQRPTATILHDDDPKSARNFRVLVFITVTGLVCSAICVGLSEGNFLKAIYMVCAIAILAFGWAAWNVFLARQWRAVKRKILSRK
jgi:hypothetical protein